MVANHTANVFIDSIFTRIQVRYRQIEADETFYEEPTLTLERLMNLEDVMKAESGNLFQTINSLSYDKTRAN